MEIIDNFLPEKEYNKIKDVVFSTSFYWAFGNILNDSNLLKCQMIDNFQFFHILYDNNIPYTQYYDLFGSVLKKLGVLSLVGMKLNLNTKTDKIIEHGFHVDYKNFKNLKTSVMYLNENDGYTKFENGDIVESKDNRIVTFDSDIFHTGTSCTDQSRRVVLNINYYGTD